MAPLKIEHGVKKIRGLLNKSWFSLGVHAWYFESLINGQLLFVNVVDNDLAHTQKFCFDGGSNRSVK